MTLLILGLLAGLLFLLGYVTKRRFGVLGLGLAAGTVLVDTMQASLTNHLSNAAFLAPLTPQVGAIILLTLLPAMILLINGPSYQKKRHARIGAALFAALGTLLIIGPLTMNVPTQDREIQKTLNDLAGLKATFITIGIGLAVGDMLLVRQPKPDEGKK